MSAIVITGAGSGLGRALAEQYSSQYNEIILIGRNQDRLEQTKEILLQKTELEVFTYPLNIQNQKEVETFSKMIFSQHKVTALINNAGVGHFGPVTQMSAEEIDEMLDTNVKGTIFLTQAFINEFSKKGTGKILNIISTAGLRGKVNESVYAASKFAVRGFTESLVKELGGSGIMISGVYMGGMDTPFWDHNDHIKDKSRLKSPETIAQRIFSMDDGRTEILVE
ncbi:SDR family NAD(P)-dependent oxidoreductase [Bacillus sp. UMB0893]|uniref:SDR family NAD(P)-dependent oxidoreductase n=1 Tax=Bacillus sp. UMB0893 TaxID=2066053 RepID=UPI000C78C9E6|nr:SDR family oxidoreductase [Bacillus sp. UMB0893]PLR66612.1 short-chain dehydrogenase [Bacillus sp. UMB0893]